MGRDDSSQEKRWDVKQALLELGSGIVSVGQIPAPSVRPGTVLVESRASVVSSGTEGMLIDFGRSNLLDKIRSQPDRVKDVLEKLSTEGLAPTLDAVRDKLGSVLTPGYCQAGVVLECGDSSAPFRPGDRVITNGPHAEIVRVPYNLAAGIPADDLDFAAAAFTPLGSIALQGFRLAAPTLGETIVVFGLGLVGQLAVQIVRASGCRCLGLDTDPARVALAERHGATGVLVGADDVVRAVRARTDGVGADAVLMTLASDSDEPMHLAAEMSRKRGRIVLVGVTGLDLRRGDFYEKELSFQVSCSYGPGRHDPSYEDHGRDYPLPFVRWTEKRNFEAVLRLMADGQLDPAPLISHRFPIDRVSDAYDLLLRDEPSLGIVLTYPARETEADDPRRTTIPLRDGSEVTPTTSPMVGIIGAGSFARRTLLPALKSSGCAVRTVVSSGGISAAVEGAESGAGFASSDADAVLKDPEVSTVFILTRHDSHAPLVVQALEAGKHVFVEKPLALTLEQLENIKEARRRSDRLMMVGFNRRFAPLSIELKDVVDRRSGPLSLVVTVNAGHVDPHHWTKDLRQGGGRIVGEACHFIDLARFFVGAPIRDLHVQSAMDGRGRPVEDVSHITVGFEDGSTAAIHYLATGSRRFPKERVEAFFDGAVAAIDNWRRLRTWGLGRRDRLFARRLDKGHEAEVAAFVSAVREGGPSPIAMDELFEVSWWSIRAAKLARSDDVGSN